MKFIKKISIVVLTLVMSVLLFNINTKAEEAGFSFSNVDIVIDVSDKGVFTVTETFDVDFNQYLHGIYINIPIEYSNYSWNVDGKQIVKDYRWPISNIKVLSGHTYDITKNSQGVSIRLGDVDYYANAHETYKIQYKVHSTDLDLNGIQSFYYNLVGDRWNNNIYNSTFTINMPKEFDASKLYFYTDGQELDPNFKYEVNGNTITGSLNTTINYGRGITVKLDLPDNYFDFSRSNTPLYITIASAIALLAFSFFAWLKYGRDDEVIVTVEFEAPKELSSAGVGYVMKNGVNNKDVASLFLEWANKGYITIAEKDDELEFRVVKDIDSNEHPYSKTFFRKIFNNKQVVSTDYLDGKYNAYMQAQHDINSYFNEKETKLFAETSAGYQVLFGFLITLPITLISIIVTYYTNYDIGSSLIYAAIIAGSLILSMSTLFNLINNYKNSGFISKISMLFSSLVLLLISFFTSLGAMNESKTPFIYFAIIWVFTILTIVITAFMQKRTKFGTDMLGKVLGLKDFIEHAEQDRINMLFEQNPQIYYHILPYAYVLGLTKVWKKHFKDLEMVKPDWYEGDNFVYNRFYSNMNSTMSSVSRPTPPAPTGRSGGGGGFSGGGFSSGGGGGFSGGGFGGSSGGGW